MKDRLSPILLIVMLGGIALVAFALLTPVELGGNHSGMNGTTRTGYELLNLVLAILGTAMASGSAAILLFRYMVPENRPSSLEQPAAVVAERSARSVAGSAASTVEAIPSSNIAATIPTPDMSSGESQLILRLLSGDEREVFRSLMDAGGEQLQRDIVEATKLSDAKVSRVLDRLEGKDLVERERRGMGNVVRVSVKGAS